MKKVLLGLSLAALVVCSFGCSKKSSSNSDASATAAAGAAETLSSIEVKHQRFTQNATDPSTALRCVYITGTNNGTTVELKKAEVKTSGQCNWAELQGKAAGAAPLSADAAARIVSAVASDSSLPAVAKDKWDCTAINVRTNVRKAGAQDCADGSGAGNAIAKTMASTLGL